MRVLVNIAEEIVPSCVRLYYVSDNVLITRRKPRPEREVVRLTIEDTEWNSRFDRGFVRSFVRQRSRRPQSIESVGLLNTIALKLRCTCDHSVSFGRGPNRLWNRSHGPYDVHPSRDLGHPKLVSTPALNEKVYANAGNGPFFLPTDDSDKIVRRI